MAENSKIAWTTHTFNPWIGCSKVHEGCTRCYAEAFSKRTGKAKWGPSGTRVKTSEAYWRQPLKWNREAEAEGVRKRVFCASLADVFEDWGGPPIQDHHGNLLRTVYPGPEYQAEDDDNKSFGHRTTLDDLRKELFALIDKTPWLDWLLLTKRPENIPRMWMETPCDSCGEVSCPPHKTGVLDRRYRENVWLGTSISNQETADKFVPELLKCRDLAPVLFLSAEPLLGPIDLSKKNAMYPDIDQVIIGVESSGTRLGRLGDFADEGAWLAAAGSLAAQCAGACTATFVKQIPVHGTLSHDPSAEWPKILRVRQFPLVHHGNPV